MYTMFNREPVQYRQNRANMVILAATVPLNSATLFESPAAGQRFLEGFIAKTI